MTTTSTRPRMTGREIALMRDIVTWRKANRWRHLPHYGYTGDPGSPAVSWYLQTPGATEIGVTSQLDVEPYEWHHVRSVTEAVDLLVALSYLPARFSSAYRAGWDKALWFMQADEHDPATYDERNLPAVEPAW